MAALHQRTIDVQLVQRRGIGKIGNAPAFEFKSDIGDWLRRWPEEVRTDGRFKHREHSSRYSIIGDILNRAKLLEITCTQQSDFLRRGIVIGIEAGPEKFNEAAPKLRTRQERTFAARARRG